MNRWHRNWHLLYHTRPARRADDFGQRPYDHRPSQSPESVQRLAAARRSDEARRRQIGFSITLGIALLMHAAFLWPLFAAWIFAPTQEGSLTSVRYVSASNLPGRRSKDRIKQDTPKKVRKKAARKQKEKPDILPDGQLVTLPASQDERPDHADYVARDNHRTERETRSRYATQYWKNPAHKPQSEQDARRVPKSTRDTEKVVRAPVSTPGGGPEGAGKSLRGREGLDTSTRASQNGSMIQVPRQRKQRRLALKTAAEGEFKNRQERKARNSQSNDFQFQLGQTPTLQLEPGFDGIRGVGRGQQGGTGQGGLPGLAALTPTWAEMDRLAGMPANDDLPEVETDAETRLNAWRWKHSTFFDRIKQAISRNWRGREVYQRHDPTRQVYGSQRLITVLQVTLDRDGEIRSLHIREASGSRDLDDEALRATRLAGPFVNPPPALFGDRDTFSFPFGFVITSQWRHVDFNWRPY